MQLRTVYANMYHVCKYVSCMQLCTTHANIYHVCNYVSCMQLLCMKYAIMRHLRKHHVCNSRLSYAHLLHTALNNPKHPKLSFILCILETFPKSQFSNFANVAKFYIYTVLVVFDNFDWGNEEKRGRIRKRKEMETETESIRI